MESEVLVLLKYWQHHMNTYYEYLWIYSIKAPHTGLSTWCMKYFMDKFRADPPYTQNTKAAYGPRNTRGPTCSQRWFNFSFVFEFGQRLWKHEWSFHRPPPPHRAPRSLGSALDKFLHFHRRTISSWHHNMSTSIYSENIYTVFLFLFFFSLKSIKLMIQWLIKDSYFPYCCKNKTILS